MFGEIIFFQAKPFKHAAIWSHTGDQGGNKFPILKALNVINFYHIFFHIGDTLVIGIFTDDPY